tara:strand:- start:691 stop:1047 length:357 start_codon:yes stop_codon:yes gene_type:complete
MDILDMVISKVDPEISRVYENQLADQKLKTVGKELRSQFETLKKLNKIITPAQIRKQRKEFRTSVIIRNIYSEVLHITQSIVMNKLSSKKLNKSQNQYLNDALMTSIAGISAAMKNTG